MCGDTGEGIVLHSAQWTMLEHLFRILKPFMIAVKDVSALAVPMNQVKSSHSSVCYKQNIGESKDKHRVFVWKLHQKFPLSVCQWNVPDEERSSLYFWGGFMFLLLPQFLLLK